MRCSSGVRIYAAVLSLFIFLSAAVAQDVSDRVLNFHSDITVHKDGAINVTETIRIYNGDGENTPGYGKGFFSYNNDIQRGIVRDFPTNYADTNGFWTKTGFRIRNILKDGIREPYVTETLTNGTRIKIGNADVVLNTGIHTYTIEYETDRQLVFEDGKDELYWNVNGNGWVFTIDTVSCIIRFPQGAVIKEDACYTGPMGSTAKKCRAKQLADNVIYFVTTEKLNSYDGLTVAAAIQKGILAPPTAYARAMSFLRANYILPLLIFLLVFILVYYILIWYRKGRDPDKGIVYPQFSPPAELTPADVGFIVEQQYGSHLFTAALVDCAVKKQLEIEVAREGLIIKSNVYHFNKPKEAAAVASTKDVYGFDVNSLFGQQARKGKYNATLRSCYLALQDALKDRFQIRGTKKNKWYGLFVLNKGYSTFGLIVLIAAVFLSFQFLVSHPTFKLLVIAAIFLCAMLIVQLIFSGIMSAYTKKGRDIADHLLGFKMYLEQAEQHVYNQLAAPEKTLDLFEKYLPYAIALKVENDWASKFDGILEKALESGYQPSYYNFSNGTMRSFSMSDMSRGISSGLSSTISSASSPPGSHGGSSGGGSSGGGGGGGGGGGW